jgi:hypothetical protein
MRRSSGIVLIFVAALGLGAGVGLAEHHEGAGEALQPVSAFAGIADEAERARALFTEAGKVMLHPRCVNCHPAGDRPLQGEESRLHEPPVLRGIGGTGVVGMRCRACHMRENFDPGGVPGAHQWVLAPRKMAWEGLSLGQLCEQVKDPERNGNRSLEEIIEHMREDDLVGWGWAPGVGREAAPGSQAVFGELIAAWVESGAACPE